MTTTSVPGELPGTTMTDEAYGALRASAALWVGTSVLITNPFGQVLVQHVDYRDTCLLAGGAVDKNESPARAAARELVEELGVTATVDRCLAIDWIAADSTDAPAAMRFPGEILHVFDGGTWDDDRIGEIRLPPSEITGIEFVEPARLPDLLSPADARRALSALRARIDAGGTVILENGLPLAPSILDRAAVLQTARPTYHYPWHHGPAPHDLAVTQVWAWCFAPDGRVLVLLEPHTGVAILPGGTPEEQDQGDPVATLRREVKEEATARIGCPLLLGHVTDPSVRRGYLRYAAALTNVGPAQPDPATGHTYIRILATPEQAMELFDWGPPAVDQLAVVHWARQQLGVPRAVRQPVTELSGPTAW
ncbi:MULTISPECIES: NUDIX hydrolase [unclassified Streptomyces]|uniref:NUDIX hydrolase n=1 Tax=Streptomyces niveiscabiei TaxID=164115 RepID=A0ABW9I4S2_9ACTN|nr:MULTISPECIES: NUDIX hydrolase [unclassified Streptomyces]MBK3642347.1 NUDIX hydrolase [Streptomyces sp. MBT33]